MTVQEDEGAALALAMALDADPFYDALAVDCGHDAAARRERLARYFARSMAEGREVGRVDLAGVRGAAVWITSQDPSRLRTAREGKLADLARVLGPLGWANYLAMTDNMEKRLPPGVPGAAWYLSIMAVAPACQGQGVGAGLLAPALADADAAGAACYLETFNPRSVPFYARLGFGAVGEAAEPLTGAGYLVMVRPGGGGQGRAA
jgi:GNAT superfamily N-acetyltransferase